MVELLALRDLDEVRVDSGNVEGSPEFNCVAHGRHSV
jgi:hypothetical protein